MTKKLFNGVDGVFMPVSDIERSINWYTNLMGFELLFRDEPHAAVMKIGEGLPVLCLVKVEDYKPIEFPKNGYGVDISFNFKAVDIDEAHSNLGEKGIDVSEIFQSGNLRHFFFKDIDGNTIDVVN